MLKAEACWITGYDGDDEDGDGDGNVDDAGDGCGGVDDDDSDNDGDCCGGGAPQSMLKAKSCWMPSDNDDAHPKIDADFAFVGVIKDCSAIRHHPLWLKKVRNRISKLIFL